jgi:sugar O-acyltransferase (sialic acid O-acetyltransferase NeuD family)
MVSGSDKFAIYGTGGFARELLPVVLEQLGESANVVFVDDQANLHGIQINGCRVISFDTAISEGRAFTVAVGDPKTRRKIVLKCDAAGAKYFDVISNSHERYLVDSCGDGLVACAKTIFTSNCSIGRHFQANIYSYVAHDCRIGDFVTFAPRVSCNGNVHVQNLAYIGTGAVLKQGNPDKPLIVGEGAVIGMGAVVTKDVAPGVTVVGNPAAPLVKVR